MELALILDMLLSPERFDQLDLLHEPPDASIGGDVEGGIVFPTEAHAEDRPTAAQVVERSDRMGHVDGAAQRQNNNRDAKADAVGDRGRVAEGHHRVEGEYMV